jgi:uracil-DNA glycosylase
MTDTQKQHAEFLTLQTRITRCRQCPRLVSWREDVARDKVKRFQKDTYWGKAVPSFGHVDAELIIIGLAPAAHGANRTGRMFTGDRSGDWLYRALHKAGFATQAESLDTHDGLELLNTCITAVCHCAPPQNKLEPDEIKACSTFLEAEFALFQNAKVFLALGQLAFQATWQHLSRDIKAKKPAFSHHACVSLNSSQWLMGSYHPSQQNTFTGKLTEPMFDAVFEDIRGKLQRACKSH